MRVYFPHQNLGCFGLEIFGWYADLCLIRDGFISGRIRGFQFYWRWRGLRHWLSFKASGIYHKRDRRRDF